MRSSGKEECCFPNPLLVAFLEEFLACGCFGFGFGWGAFVVYVSDKVFVFDGVST